MITHLVEIQPADLNANPDAIRGRLLVLHRCPACALQRRWLLQPGRWALGHTHDGTWTATRAGRLTTRPAIYDPRLLTAALTQPLPERIAG